MKQVSKQTVRGTLYAPSSKSMMQRYVALSALGSKPVEICFPSLCDDGIASLNVAKNLGATITSKPDSVLITPNLSISPGIKLDCHESGTSFRIFAAIAAIFEQEIILSGSGTLLKRPMTGVQTTLQSCGVSVKSDNSYAPLLINGPIQNEHISLDGSESSQLLSGLLIACPFRKSNTKISVTNLKSKPYVQMTLQACQEFGLEIFASKDLSSFEMKGGQIPNCHSINVEGDWSGASFLLVAGAIAGEISVGNLSLESLQADKAIIQALQDFGAHLLFSGNTVTIKRNQNLAFHFDATDCPDLFPPLVSLAAAANGRSHIKGASRLANKESNRALALIEEYRKLGIIIEHDNDSLIVQGGAPKGATVNAHSDHRIAMSLAITGLRSDTPIIIEGSESVAKSYPDFFSELEKVYE